MPFIAPTFEQLQAKLPQLSEAIPMKQGGFKQPYRVVIDGRVEALKLVLVPQVSDDEDGLLFRKECLARVTREIQVLAECKSPLLVKLGGIAAQELEIADGYFIVYSEEFLNGPDLRTLIKQQWKAPETELKLLLVSLVKAIQQLWTLPARVIHRDIKPDNIIRIGQNERPFVLLDLGIAFAVSGTSLTADPLNRRPPGTLPYLAPEMLQSNFRETIDYRSDLYAAGLTVYECAVGFHPFAKRPELEFTTVSRVLHDSPPPLYTLRPDLSKPFCQLIDSLLERV